MNYVTFELVVAVLFAATLLLFVGFIVYRRMPRKLKTQHYNEKWKQLQLRCKDKTQWKQALTDADRLLDSALRKRKYKGKSMGERMVSAQRKLTDNDAVWFAHNLYKKIMIEPDLRLKESEVRDALIGFRQALRDLGALTSDNKNRSAGSEKDQ